MKSICFGSRRGQAIVEYIIVVVLIAIAALAIFGLFGDRIGSWSAERSASWADRTCRDSTRRRAAPGNRFRNCSPLARTDLAS